MRRVSSGRLVARYGTAVPGIEPLGLGALFPTAATLRAAPLDDIGITTTRAAAIRAFAAATVPLDGSIELDDLVGELRSLRGVGEWTAQYVAMRGAGERDAFPAADLGLRHALGGSRADALAAAAAWHPWRAYAAMHLWCAAAPAPAQTRQTA